MPNTKFIKYNAYKLKSKIFTTEYIANNLPDIWIYMSQSEPVCLHKPVCTSTFSVIDFIPHFHILLGEKLRVLKSLDEFAA